MNHWWSVTSWSSASVFHSCSPLCFRSMCQQVGTTNPRLQIKNTSLFHIFIMFHSEMFLLITADRCLFISCTFQTLSDSDSGLSPAWWEPAAGLFLSPPWSVVHVASNTLTSLFHFKAQTWGDWWTLFWSSLTCRWRLCLWINQRLWKHWTRFSMNFNAQDSENIIIQLLKLIWNVGNVHVNRSMWRCRDLCEFTFSHRYKHSSLYLDLWCYLFLSTQTFFCLDCDFSFLQLT